MRRGVLEEIGTLSANQWRIYWVVIRKTTIFLLPFPRNPQTFSIEKVFQNSLRKRFPKLAELMDESEQDVLPFMTYHGDHWTKIHSTNPLERLNTEIKRRTNVVGIFPNEAAITRPPLPASSAPSSPNRTTSGPSHGDT